MGNEVANVASPMVSHEVEVIGDAVRRAVMDKNGSQVVAVRLRCAV
jgi:hypothetical protein